MNRDGLVFFGSGEIKRMTRIYVINKERRNWKRSQDFGPSERRTLTEPTRRYLMIVEDLELRVGLKQLFSTAPNGIQPHESGNDLFFYCIAGPSMRRKAKFENAIHYKLETSGLMKDPGKNLEILFP